MWTQLKAANFYLFEIFILVRSAGISISSIAQNLLIQDKVCLFTYHQNGSFCANIQQSQLPTQESEKDLVLASTAQLGNYIWILHCIPMFIWTLFIGSFLDKHSGGAILLIFLNVTGDLIAVIFYLLNTLFYSLHPTILLAVSSIYWFTGGFACYTSALYKYLVTHSEEKNRSFKFMLLDVCGVLGSSLGTFLGGQILTVRSFDSDDGPQLRTYSHNFILSIILGSSALALLCALYAFDKYRLASLRKPINCETTSLLQDVDNDLNNNCAPVSEAEPFESITIKSLFSLNNVRKSFATLFKRREQNGRLQVFTLFAILCCQIFIFGLVGVGFQFVEKVYHWDATQFSTVSAITSIMSTLIMAAMAALLVKRLQVDDGPLLVIAHLSSIFHHLIKGTFLTVEAFFVATFVGALGGFSFISIRSKMSKIVQRDEVGQLFSYIASLEAAIPIVSSSFFTLLFAFTVGSINPGAVYQCGAALLVLSLGIVVWHELKFKLHSDRAERSLF